jgi:hypothetical protein
MQGRYIRKFGMLFGTALLRHRRGNGRGKEKDICMEYSALLLNAIIPQTLELMLSVTHFLQLLHYDSAWLSYLTLYLTEKLLF